MNRLNKSLQLIVEQFDEAWQDGTPPAIHDFFHHAIAAEYTARDHEARRAFAFALIRIDLEYRWKVRKKDRATPIETRSLEDYLKLMPEAGPLERLPVELIAAEFGVLYAAGQHPSTASYERRFPQHAETLSALLLEAARRMETSGAVLPQIDGFKIEARLGAGTYGVVYKARQEHPQRVVAIKRLRVRSKGGQEELSRFRREANAIAAIDHRNVIRLYEMAVTSTSAYLVLEYAAGGTLAKKMKQWSTNPKASGLVWERWLAQLLSILAYALDAAHQKKIIHRDLTPNNVLFTDKGVPKIADFGLARVADSSLTESRAVLGTRLYMSPEQARGDRLDARTDIYSLGVILFQLLTHRLPFSGPELDANLLSRKIDAPSPRQFKPEISREIETICRKCLEKDPDERYNSARELAEDLALFSKDKPIRSLPLSRAQRGWRYMTRRPLGTALSIAAVMLVSLAVTGGLYLNNARMVLHAELEDTHTELKDKDAALDQRDEIISAQDRVVLDKSREAAAATEQKRFHAYAADCQAIVRAWGEGDLKLIRKLLDQYERVPSKEEPDLRGFEWYYWDHLLRESAKGVWEGPQPTRSLAFDSSGNYLAATGFAHLTLWDVASHNVWRRPINGRALTNMWSQDRSRNGDRSVAFSPDGRYVAATGFVLLPKKRLGSLKVWDVATGTEQLSITDDPELSGRAVAFHPAGEVVVAGCYRNGWKSWNVQTSRPGLQGKSLTRGLSQREEKEQQAGTSTVLPWDIVYDLRFSRNGMRLVTTCGERPPVVWRWPEATVDPNTILEPKVGSSTDVLRLSDSGRPTIARVVDGRVLVQLTELPARPGEKRVRKFAPDAPTGITVDAPTRITCVDMSTAALVAGGEDGMIYRWQVAQGHIVGPQTLRGHAKPITSVTFGPNGHTLSADQGGMIRFWQEDEGDAEWVTLDHRDQGCLKAHTNRSANVVEIKRSTGETVACVPMNTQTEVGATAVFSRNEHLAIVFFHGHWDLTRPKTITPDRMVCWDLRENRAVAAAMLDDLRHGVSFSDDGGSVAVLTDNGTAAIWSTKSGKEVCRFKVSLPASILLSPAGRYVAVGEERTITVWRTQTGDRLHELPVRRWEELNGPFFLFSEDESQILVDGDPWTAWEVQSGKQVPTEQARIAKSNPHLGFERHRLYRFRENFVEVYCAKTLKLLLRFRCRSKESGDCERSKDVPILGTNGIVGSDAMDQHLANLAASWRGEASQ